jgi:hypothetical protein
VNRFLRTINRVVLVSSASVATLAARALPLALKLAPVVLVLVAGLALADAASSTHLQDLTLPSDPTDLGALAGVLVTAVMQGRWGVVVSLGVTLLVAALRKFVPTSTKFGAWMHGRIGAIVFNFATSLGLAFAAVFVSGSPITVDVVVRALQVALTAAGGWTIYKAIREEIEERAAAKAGAAAAEPGNVSGNLDK